MMRLRHLVLYCGKNKFRSLLINVVLAVKCSFEIVFFDLLGETHPVFRRYGLHVIYVFISVPLIHESTNVLGAFGCDGN